MKFYHSRQEWTWEQWQWRDAPYSLTFQHYWNLAIRLFSIISRILIRGGEESYPTAEMQLVYSTAPTNWAMYLMQEDSMCLSQWESVKEMDCGEYEDSFLMKWPLWSPDLSLCDFFLLGYVKRLVNLHSLPASIDELKLRFTSALDNVTGDMLQRV